MSQPQIDEFRERLRTETVVSTILRTPAANALSAIAQLQSDVVATAATINAANFGPFPLGGSCDYDCFIGICMKTYTWSWPLDFSGVRQPLQNAVGELGNAVASFNNAFGPARNWLKSTLPQFSAEFSSQANTIMTTNAAIMQAGGIPTPMQLLTVEAAFQSINQGLGNGQSQMGGAISAAAQFVDNLTGIENGLAPYLSSMQQSMDTDVTNMQNNFVNGMECGQGDADNQVNGAIGVFNASVGTIQTSFNTLTNDTGAVQSSTSQFVATLVNILDQYQNIAGQLSTAASYPAGAIQDLHLNIAANEWAQLAQYAAANIQ